MNLDVFSFIVLNPFLEMLPKSWLKPFEFMIPTTASANLQYSLSSKMRVDRPISAPFMGSYLNVSARYFSCGKCGVYILRTSANTAACYLIKTFSLAVFIQFMGIPAQIEFHIFLFENRFQASSLFRRQQFQSMMSQSDDWLPICRF